jgi:hypothetical protein
VPATFSNPKKTSTRGQGRPSKLTPQVKAKLKEAFAYGLNDDQAAALVGVSAFTLTLWKRNPAFVKEIQGAVTERLLVRLKRIEEGENGWQGCGWILERLLPRQWAKPEVLIAVQNNLTLNGAGGSGGLALEQMVIADLQFEKLRQNPNYQHRKAEQPAREVEATVSSVPEDLSGVLKVVNHPGSAVISESQARESRRRVEQTDAKIDELLRTKQAGNGNGAPADPTSSAMVLPPIVMPPEPSPAWWGGLTSGSGEREVERATAIKIVRQIMADVFGQLRSQNTSVEFAPGAPILLRDVHSTLQALCGADGWAALRKRGEV